MAHKSRNDLKYARVCLGFKHIYRSVNAVGPQNSGKPIHSDNICGCCTESSVSHGTVWALSALKYLHQHFVFYILTSCQFLMELHVSTCENRI